MPVKVRLTRKGAKKRPFYRIVAADSESPRDGKFLDVLGHYDPFKGQSQSDVDVDGIKKWMENGAEVSETVRSLLREKETLAASS